MKFNFRLQKLLQHRKNMEDLAKKEMQDAMNELRVQESVLQQLLDQVDSARLQAFETQSGGGKTSASLQQIHDFSQGQKVRIERQKLKIETAREIAELKQQELMAAAVEHKTIDRLREKQLQVFKDDKEIKAQKQADDISVMRYENKIGK